MGLVVALLGFVGVAIASAVSASSANNVAEMTTESNEKVAQENNTVQKEISDSTIASNENIAAQQIAAQKEINSQNIAFQQAENEITRQREDNALQRKMADGLAAGLSPLGAMGYTGSSAQSLTAPSFDGSGIFSALGNLMSGNTSARANLASAIGSNAAKRIDSNNTVANIKANAITQRLDAARTVIDSANSLYSSYGQMQKLLSEIGLNNQLSKTQSYKNDYYEKFGYSELDWPTLITNILSGLGYSKDKIPDLVDSTVHELSNPETKSPDYGIALPKYDKDSKDWVKPDTFASSKKDRLSSQGSYYFPTGTNIDTLREIRSKLNQGKLSLLDADIVSKTFKNQKNPLPFNWYFRFKKSSGYRQYVVNMFNRYTEAF